MPQQKVNLEASRFTPSALLELWELDGTMIGLTEILYFYNGTNNNFQPVTFNGLTYTPFPIKIEDVDMDGKGQLPRPKITVANINGFVSNILLQNSDLAGAQVTRRKVFARFIDASNFPSLYPRWLTPDPTAAYPDETWTVNRKIVENPQVVQWELASPLETQGVKLPKRLVIANTCTWKYRDPNTCGYSGAPAADKANKVFGAGGYGFTLVDQGLYNPISAYTQGDYVYIYSSLPQFAGIKIYYVCAFGVAVGIYPAGNSARWIPDSCQRGLAACKCRFGNNPLRTSAYPGVTRAGYIG